MQKYCISGGLYSRFRLYLVERHPFEHRNFAEIGGRVVSVGTVQGYSITSNINHQSTQIKTSKVLGQQIRITFSPNVLKYVIFGCY